MIRLNCLILSLVSTAVGRSAPLLPLTSDDVVVFTGGTEIVEMQESGHLETLLTARFAQALPKFRDLAWEADTVSFQGTIHGQWRTKGHFDDIVPFGNWADQLKRVGATAIIMQYGTMEILEGQRVDGFINELNLLLEEFTEITQRLEAFADPHRPAGEDLERPARGVALLAPGLQRFAPEGG